MAKAQELAGDRIVEVAAGDVRGQVLAAGLVDEVRVDVVHPLPQAGCWGSRSSARKYGWLDDVPRHATKPERMIGGPRNEPNEEVFKMALVGRCC